MIPLRLARELTYQLDKAHEHERLARALAKISIFLALWKDDESQVLTLWQQLASKGFVPEKYYPDSLEALRKNASTILPDALLTVFGLFASRGAYDLTVELLTELLACAEERKDEKLAAQAHSNFGGISYLRGEFDEAMTHFTQSLSIAESLMHKPGMSRAIGNMGLVYLGLGRNAEAMACFERHFALSESLGNKRGMSLAIGNMGTVHRYQGRYAEAMACFEQQLAMCESLGDKSGMASAIGSMGDIHSAQGRYSEAMASFEQYLGMAELLGDKRGISTASASLGILHYEQGRYAEAMACFERHCAMAESLRNKNGMSIAIGNMGNVQDNQGRHEEALRSFRSALEGHRVSGFRYGMTYWLEGIARTLLESNGNLVEAREDAEECIQISEELFKPDTLFPSHILLARIDAAEGNVALATQKLEAMLAETTEEEQIADLHYWLWKIGDGNRVPGPGVRDSDAGDSLPGPRSPDPVLTMYEKLYSRIPKFEFRKRIAELKGERIPMSADDLESLESNS
jgi:tetratricopeptide (TPR) repeat protein